MSDRASFLWKKKVLREWTTWHDGDELLFHLTFARSASVLLRTVSKLSRCANTFRDWILRQNVFSSSGRATCELQKKSTNQLICTKWRILCLSFIYLKQEIFGNVTKFDVICRKRYAKNLKLQPQNATNIRVHRNKINKPKNLQILYSRNY